MDVPELIGVCLINYVCGFFEKSVQSFINFPGQPVALNSLEIISIEAPYILSMNIIFQNLLNL